MATWRAQRAAVGELEDRARLLFVCADRLRNPSEKLPRSGAPVAAELYSQSADAARQALARLRGTDEAQQRHTLLEDVWSLDPDQQDKRAAQLRADAKVMLDELELPLRARDSLVAQRALRIGAILAAVGGLVGSIGVYTGWAEQSRDLAREKPWRTSSTYNNMGCASPQQQCSESPDFFFHTREESNPWLEIDLGQPTQFTGMRVINRRDCCFERAVPLIIEVSDTQEGFREISRRETSFNSWLATFAPTKARYVRVRAPSRTSLHLAQVRILR
jgi:hypothetical protein